MAEYTRPRPSFEAAARGNAQELLAVIHHLHNRILDLERRTASGSFSDSGPVASMPPQATFTAKSSGAQVTVEITNPEYVLSNTPGARRGNTRLAPIIHRLSYSTSPRFGSGVSVIPPSSQTHFALPAGTPYVKLESSYDGKTFNSAQIRKVG